MIVEEVKGKARKKRKARNISYMTSPKYSWCNVTVVWGAFFANERIQSQRGSARCVVNGRI